MRLGAAFVRSWRGAPAGPELDAELLSCCARGRAAWPDIVVPEEQFCHYLAERAPPELPAEVALQKLRVAELYLACACSLGNPAALRAFDEQFLSRVSGYLSRLRVDQPLVEETRQALRVRLLLASSEGPPRIAQYSGLGAFDAWVRVAAVRVALNLLSAHRRHAGSESLDEQALLADGDFELDYLRGRYRESFGAALRRAVAELSAGDRALLKFYFVDGLTPGHIGGIYGLHRTTALRRIAAAKQLLLDNTRAQVMRELQVSSSECDSLVGLLRSQLPMTLSSLFRSQPK